MILLTIGCLTVGALYSFNNDTVETTLIDTRTDAAFEKTMPLDDYNSLIDFIFKMEDDQNPYCINMANARFG